MFLIILLVLSLPSVHASECVEHPPGLISWWPGDGHAFDIVSENHGTLENGATYAPGMVGQAFSFDGTDDFVTFSESETGQLQQLTIELWVKLNTLRPDRIQRFFTIDNEKAVLRSDYGRLHFYMRIAGELRSISVENVLKAGVFHYVVGTYDGQVMRLYLDGVQVGSLKISGTVEYGEYISFSNPDIETLDGLLDEVGIYNRALIASEIQEIYKAGSSGKCKIASITGRVTDAETGNSIGGAKVTADGGQATTDSGGFFSLSVDAMSYTLTVSKQGYQTSTPLRVTVGPGETQNIQVTITESAATITGRVTDAKRGNPISGATVRADSGQATTNYAGYFSLSVKAGTYTLTLSKQGYQTSTTQVKVDPGENQSVVFTLTESTATITGRVTDAETGDPVSGATITAGSEQTTTDSGGSFSLGVDATSYTLTVSKQGYQTSTPLRVTVGPGETQNVIITLTKSTATINGRVTDAESGDPVRGVTVTTDGGQTTTDTDGSFSLSVVVGTHTLTLRKEGYDTNTLQVNVSPGETKDVHATLSESSSTITGTVTDAKTGNPINGATIKVNGEQATTDSGGSFSLSVKAGTYTMTITQQGYKTSTNPITVDPGTTKNVPMIISSAGLPLVPIAAGIGGIVIVAIVAYLKTRKPVERVPKPYALRITAEPIKLPADGTSTSNIIVELINEEGDPIRATEDVKVVLSTSTGSITSPLTISEGETTGTSTLRSSLETGNVKVLAESKGLKGASISLAFTERKRYCMHCGAQMSIADPVCPNCRQMPPSGVDVKQCPNCAEIMPSIAKFCGKCGARQQTRQ